MNNQQSIIKGITGDKEISRMIAPKSLSSIGIDSKYEYWLIYIFDETNGSFENCIFPIKYKSKYNYTILNHSNISMKVVSDDNRNEMILIIDNSTNNEFRVVIEFI